MLAHYSFFALLSLVSFRSAIAEKIDFTVCQETALIEGLAQSVDISPCDRAADDEPCRFRFGHKYKISSWFLPDQKRTRADRTSSASTVEYTPLTSAEEPRASLEARDDYQDPSLRYAYSGQAFDGRRNHYDQRAFANNPYTACEYTACPVQGGKPSTYTYEFNTLQSVRADTRLPLAYRLIFASYVKHFNHLTINATTDFSGPSFLCVSFDALFMPSVAGRAVM